MAYNQNRIEYPSDPDIPIWRYFTFPKFMDLLTSRALFFCRADKFEDKFEGYVNNWIKESLKNEFKEFENEEEMKGDLLGLLSQLGEFTLISCWNMNYTDTLGMWKSYCDDKEGIAIKTNIEKLKNSIVGDKNDIFEIRPVKYFDIENAKDISINAIDLFTRKRLHFEYEKELRIILPFAHKNKDEKKELTEKGNILVPYEYGKKVFVNLNELISEVYIAPNANTWFVEMIEKIMKVTFDKPVKKSEISKSII